MTPTYNEILDKVVKLEAENKALTNALIVSSDRRVELAEELESTKADLDQAETIMMALDAMLSESQKDVNRFEAATKELSRQSDALKKELDIMEADLHKTFEHIGSAPTTADSFNLQFRPAPDGD